MTSDAAPPFVVGGPTSAAWREDGLMRAQELEGLAEWMMARAPDRGDAALKSSIDSHLTAVREVAGNDDPRPWRRRTAGALRGSGVERTQANLDAVETDLLRMADLDYLRGQMPSLVAHVQRFLPKDDPRRKQVSTIDGACTSQTPIGDCERNAVIGAYHAASSQRRRDLVRLRSFRNVILGTAFLLALVAVGMAILGVARPDALPLCFTPSEGNQVCPTGSSPSGTDVWLVEAVGLVAAAVAAAFSLRDIRGTSTPYSLPAALALLKLPTGALTAVLGLLLMRGEFVPGLSALDSSGQIVAWAVIFGYAQQLFTGLVDRQAGAVLKDVGGHGAAGDRPTNAS